MKTGYTFLRDWSINAAREWAELGSPSDSFRFLNQADDDAVKYRVPLVDPATRIGIMTDALNNRYKYALFCAELNSQKGTSWYVDELLQQAQDLAATAGIIIPERTIKNIQVDARRKRLEHDLPRIEQEMKQKPRQAGWDLERAQKIYQEIMDLTVPTHRYKVEENMYLLKQRIEVRQTFGTKLSELEELLLQRQAA